MIACFDVHYFDDHANAAAVVFDNWSDANAVETRAVRCEIAADYVAGQFYQRELEPLLTLISNLDHRIQTFVIDAYCHLSQDGAPGLGQFLHDQLGDDKSVVGVAKSKFRNTNHAIEVLRGSSIRPLFVTAVGIDYPAAADFVRSMHGTNRIPTLLKKVDQLSRLGS